MHTRCISQQRSLSSWAGPVFSMPVQRVHPRIESVELSAMCFLHWMALASWTVPLTLVLNAHGLQSIQPLAFAASAVGSIFSPLFFGAMADRHYAPTRVLRVLATATGLAMALASTAIQFGWTPWLVLALIQVYALCSAPTVSISTTIVMSCLSDPRRQFGPIRAMGTLGWMAGCWLVSALNADASTLSGFSGAAVWLALAAFTFTLPEAEPPKSAEHLNWHERLGLDALTLLRQPDHRVVFLSIGLVSIPLAAFYPYTPPHMRDVGLEHASAWMSLAQTTEIATMFVLGALLARWRLKWILLIGLGGALMRYLLFSTSGRLWLLAGVTLHGINYTLFFTTAQIYVNERVEPEWRTRAQALLTLMNGGVGNLIGYLGCGWWFRQCGGAVGTRWPLFWGVLAGGIAAVMTYFLVAYHDPERQSRTSEEAGIPLGLGNPD
jgi:nucleoside transporter